MWINIGGFEGGNKTPSEAAVVLILYVDAGFFIAYLRWQLDVWGGGEWGVLVYTYIDMLQLQQGPSAVFLL